MQPMATFSYRGVSWAGGLRCHQPTGELDACALKKRPAADLPRGVFFRAVSKDLIVRFAGAAKGVCLKRHSNPFRWCRLSPGKGGRGVCKKPLRLVPSVSYGFRKGRSAQPRALFKVGHCALRSFFEAVSKGPLTRPLSVIGARGEAKPRRKGDFRVSGRPQAGRIPLTGANRRRWNEFKKRAESFD